MISDAEIEKAINHLVTGGRIEQIIERLRSAEEALKFYADRENIDWCDDEPDEYVFDVDCHWIHDIELNKVESGLKARAHFEAVTERTQDKEKANDL